MKRRFYRKPHRYKRGKSIFKNQFFWLGVLILLFFSSLFYLALSPIFQIEQIQISGNQSISVNDIRYVIEKELFARISNFFLVSPGKIENKLLLSLPEIGKLDVERKFPDGLVIKIEERKPAAVFNQNDNYFLLDSQGIIFRETTEPQSMVVQNLALTEEVKLGERAVEKLLISQILEIKERLEERLKILINRASIVSAERLNVETVEGWEIYFNLKGNLDWQITELVLVLEKKIPSKTRKNLEYIDLRFSRVYYK